MYKLVISKRQGTVHKDESKEYYMTQVGMCQAEADFEELTHRPEVMQLRLFRIDIHGVRKLKMWKRETE